MARKIYLAGPMRGYSEFNFPAFHSAAKKLREQGWDVFSPAEKDESIHGSDFSKSFQTGSLEDATKKGFSLRRALSDDTAFICNEADAIALLPGWEASLGANAELALSRALDLEVIFLDG